MRSSRLQETKPQDDRLKAPSPSEWRPRRGIVEFVPPLRGDSGGCAFRFLMNSFFTYSVIFKIDPHNPFMVTVKNENDFPLTYTFPTRGEEKRTRSFSFDGRRLE